MTSEISTNLSQVSSAANATTAKSAPTCPTASVTIEMSVPDAVAQLLQERRFLRLLHVFAKDRAPILLADAARAQTEAEFQRSLGVPLLSALLEQTAKQVTILGTEHLENLPACLYISNHRDILLDTAILNRALIERDKSIPHIIIGDNLLKATFLQPFYRLCRSVVVQRELKGKELFEHSLRLSEFVRSALTRNEPVWIAQRPGRTKDGIDRTEPALLRMLLLSYERKNDCCNQLLYVTPVAVSYEIEPCDVFKAAASIGVRTKNASTDRARHDTANILRGLVQPKGRITLAFRPPIVLDNSDARSSNRADKLATLASQVDREIADGYTLWPTNYIAYDLLRGRESYVEHYTNDERLRFVDYVERRALEIEAPIEHARRALLALYARPVSAEQTALALSSPQHDRGSRTVA
jgi:hypothetical protein